jgi:CRP/FNR family transcriptional regulator
MVDGDMAVATACIGDIWIFNDLSSHELQAIAQAALRRVYNPGEAIFTQGSPADKMFLIKAGRVKLGKLTEDGTEITLDIRKAGDFVGENMLGEDMDYPVTARCMEKTLFCGFTKELFEKLILDHPSIGLQVIRNLSGRITWLTSHVENLSAVRLEDRLYRILSNVAREHGVKDKQGVAIQFPLTHEDLSFLAGAHRVSITRAMKNLRESGKIVQQGKTLLLPAEGGFA